MHSLFGSILELKFKLNYRTTHMQCHLKTKPCQIVAIAQLFLPALQLQPLFEPNPSHLVVRLFGVNFLGLLACALWCIM
jgi:hypothetical protein